MPNKIKIMIIEDEDAISNFIATTLKANAYAPLLAKTAGQALSMIPSHCPDLILLDLGIHEHGMCFHLFVTSVIPLDRKSTRLNSSHEH